MIVIGMGPGGEEVAGRLAQAGPEVAGVEPRLAGWLRAMIHAYPMFHRAVEAALRTCTDPP